MEEDEKVLALVKKARTQFKARSARLEDFDDADTLRTASPGSVCTANYYLVDAPEAGPINNAETATPHTLKTRDLHALSESLPALAWYFELAILTHRSFVNLWRNPVLLKCGSLS